MRFLFLLSSLAAFTLIGACGSKDTAPPPTGGGKHVDAATAGALSGKVVFQGVPPAAGVVNMAADPACGAENTPSEAMLVNASGDVQNAFVYLKDGLEPAYSFEVPTATVVLDQKGCHYTPRVFGVRVGQTVQVNNDDATLHNVHSLPRSNREFNHSTPFQGAHMTTTFTVPEIMVRLTCNVHAWMTAYAGVVAHPFFAVTGPDGRFEIKGLPPGTYTFEAWHERFGTQTQSVTIGDRQAQTVTFTFVPKT